MAETLDATGTSGDLPRRLAASLADMIPGAARIRVHFQHPQHTWPHPCARAYDAAGRPIRLTRTQAVTAARWVMRAHPDAALAGEVHDFDLASARLTSAALPAAGRER
ncbi:hypothetical protein [Streptomyces aidingensis]|uniref:Uncharacterized protein n=1 Tax=Streptomyces aidingensis TaxID=910347 RepID=A0A1I1KFS3_9ACTN|nr:hypothetical protein [Streptomyces aidingensis]SFC59132.1 hypothetical protein SAMN05421773_104199 [Streptomyces aidingensis]